MSTGVSITIIAGLVCVLIAFFYQKNRGLRVGLGILGILLLTFGGYSYGTLQPAPYMGTYQKPNKLEVKYPIERIQVISPLDKDSVKCRILTMGVYPETHIQDIWVLLKPSDDKYYPQSDDTFASYKRKGEWQVVTRFGGDEGEAYDLVVFEADAKASQFFNETIATWKAANAYPGLEIEDLPESAVEVDRITLTLSENCRGVNEN